VEASRAADRPLPEAEADHAFEELYERHARDVYRYALALLANPADAEDVTQTAFLNAYRAYRRGERPLKPHNWLIAITHNVCRMRWRQAGARPREVTLEEAPEPVAHEHERPNLDEALAALASLSFNQRAALVMRELEGRTYREIADVLGLSTSAVEALLFRARRRLRLNRDALGVIAGAPLPGSLSSLAGGGGAAAVATGGSALGAGLALKAAALVAVSAVTAGLGYKSVQELGRSREVAVAHTAAVTPRPHREQATAARVTRSAAAKPVFHRRPQLRTATPRVAPSRPVATPTGPAAPTPQPPQPQAEPPAPQPAAGAPPTTPATVAVPPPVVAVPAVPPLPSVTVPAPSVPELPVPTPQLPPLPALPSVPAVPAVPPLPPLPPVN
jgi:RNA polymerase sigma factor (sigma-70 family)